MRGDPPCDHVDDRTCKLIAAARGGEDVPCVVGRRRAVDAAGPRHLRRKRRHPFRRRVELFAGACERPVDLAGCAVRSAVQLAAEDEPQSCAGSDRQKGEVLDPACDARPPFADRGQVDVVVERHRYADAFLHLGAEGSPFEPCDMRLREAQRLA